MERKLPTEAIYRIGNITYTVISKYSDNPNAMTLEEKLKQIFLLEYTDKNLLFKNESKKPD